MGLESFREAGWFNKPIELNFDLNQEQIKKLRNWETVEVVHKDHLYSIALRGNTEIRNLKQEDFVINLIR
jgi:hypothetical protein